MTNLQEVPTEELLSFQDYPTVHSASNNQSSGAQISVDLTNAASYNNLSQPNPVGPGGDTGPTLTPTDGTEPTPQKVFWTLQYYQKFFDVDTKDVTDRILASLIPRRENTLKHHLREKPDLYGPFWISVTLIFTIAISGNIANYLQHVNTQYHWKYDFHLVSYAATAIFMYVTLIPFTLWGLIKWSSEAINELEDPDENRTPGIMELMCVYGYSLFIYIPISILWTIQISTLQWMLVLIAALLSGAVLLLTLMPALQRSKHKFFIIIGIICCHLLLAAGFMMYFFHSPDVNTITNVVPSTKTVVQPVVNGTAA